MIERWIFLITLGFLLAATSASAETGRATPASAVSIISTLAGSPCNVLGDVYPGIVSAPANASLLPPHPYPGLSPPPTNLTDGEVVNLFDAVCGTPAFSSALDQAGEHNFSIGASYNETSRTSAVSVGFDWVGGCSDPEPGSQCTFEEYWLGNVSSDGTVSPAGPFTLVGLGGISVPPAAYPWLGWGSGLSVGSSTLAIFMGVASGVVVALVRVAWNRSIR